jgi:hypothetical protein
MILGRWRELLRDREKGGGCEGCKMLRGVVRNYVPRLFSQLAEDSFKDKMPYLRGMCSSGLRQSLDITIKSSDFYSRLPTASRTSICHRSGGSLAKMTCA